MLVSEIDGAPGTIRTSDPQIRSLKSCPLRASNLGAPKRDDIGRPLHMRAPCFNKLPSFLQRGPEPISSLHFVTNRMR